MTLLVASIGVETVDALAGAAESAWRQGADAVEVRLDALPGAQVDADVAALIHREPRRRWIITCRSRAEGGASEAPAEARFARVLRVARSGTPAGHAAPTIDIEHADWEALCPRVMAEWRNEQQSAPRIILSRHAPAGLPADLPQRLAAMERDVLEFSRITADRFPAGEAPVILKTAFGVNDITESFAAFDVLSTTGRRVPVIAIAMGEAGLWSRVLAGKLGAYATFCALTPREQTAPGQLTLRDMLDTYGFRRLGRDTRVYGLVGDPVAHSMSPRLHNEWFASSGIDAVYVPLLVTGGAEALRPLLSGCATRAYLHVGGLSVTIPHKEAALAACIGRATPLARRAGAANTLIARADGWHADNTDTAAAVDALTNALGGASILRGLRIDLLGTGGAARGVLAGLSDSGAEVTIHGRSDAQARQLAAEFGARAAPWSGRLQRRGEVVVNATSVGMHPAVDASPLPPESLAGCRLVFDLIYNPIETKLLGLARRAGVATLGGLEMFVRQAASQFALWTGVTPDLDTGRRIVRRCLGGSASPPTTDGYRRCAPLPRVSLIGYRGSGKTTVGRLLAGLVGGVCVDTDELIEAGAGCSIAELFQGEGESGFRRREAEAVAQAIAGEAAVISVGGGAILDRRNTDALRASTVVVWLAAPPEVLAERIATDPNTARTRPALTKLDPVEEIRRVLAGRLDAYQRAADIVLDTANLSAGETAERVRVAVRAYRPATKT
jgi:3-dehydroquinate dehydratase/shikimate dehydrogenase